MKFIKNHRALLIEDLKALVITDLHIGLEYGLYKSGFKIPKQTDIKKTRVFLNASLSSIAERLFNEEIRRVLTKEGFECILPQEDLPPGRNTNAIKTLRNNKRLIESSDIVLSVLDKPSEGVIFELGVAFALGKHIVIFRSDEQDYLGKIVEGIYQLIPENRKTGNLQELGAIIKRCLKIKH